MIKVKKFRSVEERSGLEMRGLMDNETKRAESLFLAGEFAESLSLLKELAKDPANGRDQYLLGLFYFYAVEVRWNGDGGADIFLDHSGSTYIIPKLSLYSTGLMPPKVILIRSSLYQ